MGDSGTEGSSAIRDGEQDGISLTLDNDTGFFDGFNFFYHLKI